MDSPLLLLEMSDSKIRNKAGRPEQEPVWIERVLKLYQEVRDGKKDTDRKA